MNRIQDFLTRYQTTGWAIALMLGGFLFQLILLVIFLAVGEKQLFSTVLEKLILPASFTDFARQPWSLVTWPFFEVNFLRVNGSAVPDGFGLLISGILIWFFGRVHQQLLGDLRTRRLLILAIPIIGLLTVTYSSVVGFYYPPQTQNQVDNPFQDPSAEAEDASPSNDPIQNMPEGTVPGEEATQAPQGKVKLADKKFLLVGGGTALIMMLVVSCITLVPDYPIQLFFIGQVKILWIGIVLVGLTIALDLFYTPLAFAEAVGALLGFLHIYLLKRGTDVTESVWNYYKGSDNPKPRMKVKRNPEKTATIPRPRRSATRKEKGSRKGDDISQEVIDKILDKISEHGYESLSREEKELLFRASTEKEDENNA